MFDILIRRALPALAVTLATFPAAASARVASDAPLTVAAAQQGQVPGGAAGRLQAAAPDGFRWEDAGLGAGAVLVLLGAGSTAAHVGRRRRTSHAHAAIG